ncbi:DUF3482 domain-containing protein, partial [Neisseria meningitidis]
NSDAASANAVSTPSAHTANAVCSLISRLNIDHYPAVALCTDKLAGRQTLHTDPETLTLLAARALDLLHVLQTRGHAAQSDIELHSRKAPWDAARLPPELNKARSHWKWSSLNTHRPETSRAERAGYVEKLQIRLSGKYSELNLNQDKAASRRQYK